MHGATLEASQQAWEAVEGRFGAYALVLPGAPSFICQAEFCTAHCCHAFSVNLGEGEVARMARTSGLAPVTFLESEDGTPIALPLAQPYLLARRDGNCVLLGANMRCTQYEGRPAACRLYPHFVVAVDRDTGRPCYGDAQAILAAVEVAASGSAPGALVPLLVRHTACPGFTGPPLTEEDWRALFIETARLQLAPEAGSGWPVPGPGVTDTVNAMDSRSQ
jgi:Fe-S-cluster containining protein